MLVTGVLIFAIVTFIISFMVANKGVAEKGKAATLVTLVAWSALIFGLYIGRTVQ